MLPESEAATEEDGLAAHPVGGQDGVVVEDADDDLKQVSTKSGADLGFLLTRRRMPGLTAVRRLHP